MVCRRIFASLDQFLKLAAEHIVHLQLASDCLGNIHLVRAARVEIHFLQDQNVSVHAAEEIYGTVQLLASVNVPVYNPERLRSRNDRPVWSKVTGYDLAHLHIYTVAVRTGSGRAFWVSPDRETQILAALSTGKD